MTMKVFSTYWCAFAGVLLNESKQCLFSQKIRNCYVTFCHVVENILCY